MNWVWEPHHVGMGDKEHGFCRSGMSSVITIYGKVNVHILCCIQEVNCISANMKHLYEMLAYKLILFR